MAARKLQRAPPVRLDPVTSLPRNQCRRHDCAFHTQLRQLAVDHKPCRAGFLTDPQLVGRAKLPDQLEDRIFAVGDRAQAAHFAIRLGYCHGNRFGVDIQTQQSYLLSDDQFPPIVALDCSSANKPSLTHDQRIEPVTP